MKHELKIQIEVKDIEAVKTFIETVANHFDNLPKELQDQLISFEKRMTEQQFKQEYQGIFNCEPLQEWNSNTKYKSGEQVLYHGKVCYASGKIGVAPDNER